MNILVIMEDALRPCNMSCYGYPKPTTPNCDRLAAEGVRFEQCIAVSAHTFPPVVSMLTGEFPDTHGLMDEVDYAAWKKGERWQGKRIPLQTLAEAGWNVDGEFVTRWAPLGFSRDRNDVFDYIADPPGNPWFYFAEPYPTHLPYDPPEDYRKLFVDAGYRLSPAARTRLETVRTKMICHPSGTLAAMEAGQEDSIGNLDDEAHERTSAVVDLEAEDEPGVRALYDGEVRVFDDLVGAILERLETRGILDDTLVVLISDHGEELLERGHVGHTSCNLMGTLYDECIHVPLIMRYPPAIPARTLVEHQVSQVDLLPTIFDLAGVPFEFPGPGASLLPLIREETTEFRPESYAETPPAGWQALRGDRRRLYCIRTLEWKLVAEVEAPGKPPVYRLFHLVEDPGEQTDIYMEAGERVIPLKEKLRAYMAARESSR